MSKPALRHDSNNLVYLTLGMIVGIIVAFIIADTPLETLLNTWQVLLGAAATIFAGYLAYQGTQKQIQQAQQGQIDRASGIRIIMGIESKKFSQKLIRICESIENTDDICGITGEHHEPLYKLPKNCESQLDLLPSLYLAPEDIMNLSEKVREMYIGVREDLHNVLMEILSWREDINLLLPDDILSEGAKQISNSIREVSVRFSEISDYLNGEPQRFQGGSDD